MKYFTKDMVEGWQTPYSNRWDALFPKRLAAYRKQLGRLRSRLSARSYRFFAEETLHDGRLISLNVLDLPGSRVGDADAHRRPNLPDVEIRAVNGKQDKLYVLKYARVRKFQLDYPSDKPLFHLAGTGIGWWEYDELTAAGRKHLRHEVLFSSGSTLLIEFEKVVCKCEPLEPRRAGSRSARR